MGEVSVRLTFFTHWLGLGGFEIEKEIRGSYGQVFKVE